MNNHPIPDEGPFRGRSTHQALSQLRTRARSNAARGLRRPAVATAMTLAAGALVCAGIFAMAWNGRTVEENTVAAAAIDERPGVPGVVLVGQHVDASSQATNQGIVLDDGVIEQISPLGAANPRWGNKNLPKQALTPSQLRSRSLTRETATPGAHEETALTALQGLTDNGERSSAGSGGDPFASIDEEAPEVEIAETEAEAAALEAKLDMAPEIDTASTSAIPAADLAPATVTRYVNLRAGPADETEVLMVVPANAKIEAEEDCGWCTVVYEGKRGFIYKSFIRHK